MSLGKSFNVEQAGNLNRLSGLLIALPIFIILAKWPILPTGPLFLEIFSLKGFFGQTSSLDEILLFIPLGAFLTVLIRLTLGIQVLGPFRPLLIAMAFQVTGILLGCTALIVVSTVIALMSPFIKRARLPYFARMAVLLNTVVVLVIGTLIASRWFEIYTLLTIAYLPMIAISLAADGFARALYKEGFHVALWKGGMTVVSALVIYLFYLIADAYDWEEVLSRFPELLVMQIGMVIIVAEHLNLRIFESLNPISSAENESSEI